MADALFSPSVLVVGVAVFVAVLLLMEGAYLLWQSRYGREARRLDERLQALAGSRQRAEAEVLRQRAPAAGLVQGWLEEARLWHSLRLTVSQAGLDWNPGRIVLASALAGVLVLVLVDGVARQSTLVAGVLALLAAASPWLYVLWRRERRLGRLQSQLPEALDLMVRALRAGHAFSSALQMVADEMAEPIASEFRTVHDEVNYGLSLPQAFDKLVERIPLTDLRYFVVAVMIQREAGGNLTELLSKLSQLIRARLKLLMRVRVLSSEGRLSGLILVVMPFALGGLLSLLNPGFMRPLWTDPLGQTILSWLAALMVVGVLVMRKIIRIRV